MILPLKFKKDIVKFCREYESLATPHVIEIPINMKVEISWVSDDTTEINYLNNDNVDNTKKIINNNLKIKSFIKRTSNFGKKYFNNKNWLWEHVLWKYRPECYEKFIVSKHKWIKSN